MEQQRLLNRRAVSAAMNSQRFSLLRAVADGSLKPSEAASQSAALQQRLLGPSSSSPMYKPKQIHHHHHHGHLSHAALPRGRTDGSAEAHSIISALTLSASDDGVYIDTEGERGISILEEKYHEATVVRRALAASTAAIASNQSFLSAQTHAVSTTLS